jgi:hypothetical protein
MFVPTFLRLNSQMLDNTMNLLKNVDDEVTDVPYRLLIAVDYIYHHTDNDYDDGLSFLDRLNKKLGVFHPEWDIQSMKNEIEHSLDPQGTYTKTIAVMLANPADRMYYGF